MNERQNTVAALFKLGWQNALRWRWRLLTIAILIGVSIMLYLVYNGLIADRTAEGVARIQLLEISYFDMLVILDEDQIFVEPEQRQSPSRGRVVVADSEGALYAKMSSPYGNLRLLGLQPESRFFHVDPQDLQGRMAIAPSEVVLPLSWAELYDVNLDTVLAFILPTGLQGERAALEARVVGLYRDRLQLPLALTTFDTLQVATSSETANAWLVTLNRAEATYEHLEVYAEQLYPGATQISAALPERLGKVMLSQAYQPGTFVLAAIFIFMGVGVLTIALMTFLERRKELATLKAVGITNKFTVVLFGFEYSLSGLLGLILTIVAFALLVGRIPWFLQLDGSLLYQMLIHGIVIAISVLCLALVYPIAIARAATVDQLQYTRNIPLHITRLDHLENPTGVLVEREHTENVRIIRIPFEIDRYTCMLFKQVGDPVKKGEVVASEELYQGHIIHHFLAPCDGSVIELNASNMVIAPSNPDEPFYPYPTQLAAEYRHSIEVFERARQKERAKIEQENRQ